MKLRAALLGAVAVLGLAPAAFAERGTDGEVKLTFPQAVSIMNPYLSGGHQGHLRRVDGSRTARGP